MLAYRVCFTRTQRDERRRYRRAFYRGHFAVKSVRFFPRPTATPLIPWLRTLEPCAQHIHILSSNSRASRTSRMKGEKNKRKTRSFLRGSWQQYRGRHVDRPGGIGRRKILVFRLKAFAPRKLSPQLRLKIGRKITN